MAGHEIERFYFEINVSSGVVKTMDRVICIWDDPAEDVLYSESEYKALSLLKKGCIYTIENKYINTDTNSISYDLKEIYCDTDMTWREERFKPYNEPEKINHCTKKTKNKKNSCPGKVHKKQLTK